MRLEHLSDRRLPGLSQPARGLRPERECRRAYESAAQSVTDVESGKHDVGLYGDEGKLVHLRHLPGTRGLVPLAGAFLAWNARVGSAQPRKLPPGVSLLQLAGKI